MTRREMLTKGAGVVACVAGGATMAEAEVKPLNTATLTRSLLGLMDRALKAGMDGEAELLRETAEKVLRGVGKGKGARG